MMLVVKCPPKRAPATCTRNISLGKDTSGDWICNMSRLMTFSYLVSLWSHVVIIYSVPEEAPDYLIPLDISNS